MFKNLNDKLVYKFPLIWNTKIVPFLIISVVLHVLFFAVGYQNSMINSVELHDYYNESQNVEVIMVFAVIISLLLFIIWCVLYFRNNAFKSFYPKGNFDLFKEWILILIVCIFNFSYAISAILGANVQTRNIMSRAVAVDRCETISQASLFLDGDFKEGLYESINGIQEARQRDSFVFEGHKYALNSLMNKNIESFQFFTASEDSLTRLKVQRWMKSDNKQEISKIFKDYLNISKIHRLKSNISASEWMDLVYDYPDFTNYKVIGTTEKDLEYNYPHLTEAAVVQDAARQDTIDFAYQVDTLSYVAKTVNGENYIYSKYFVSHKALHRFYAKIANSWLSPLIEVEFFTIIIYLCFGVSLVIFSFRVTSARNWIIALISLGIVAIFIALGAFVFYYGLTFPVLYLLYFCGVVIYFAYVYLRKKGKGFSGIALNQILWMLLSFFPLIYVMVLDIIKSTSGYYDRYDSYTGKNVQEFPIIDWLEYNSHLLGVVNLLLVVLLMLYLSVIIKRWKGISEE